MFGKFKFPISVFVLVMCVLSCLVGMSAEATATVTPEAAPWWASILQYAWEGIAAILGTVITWFFVWLQGRVAKTETEKEAIKTIQAAVALVEVELVAEIRADLADGKIDAVEMARIRSLIWNKAIEIAKGPAKDSLLQFGKPLVEGWIQQILNKFRSAPVATPPTT
jgi:hypothetical protein